MVIPEEPANPSGDWARQVLADHADDLTWQEILGPVNTCMVVATEAIFSQDKAARVPCSPATQVSANAGLRENGPRPFRQQRGDHTSVNRP